MTEKAIAGTFLLFLGLKLTGNLDWSWWWITAPLWGSMLIFVLFAAAFVVARVVCSGRSSGPRPSLLHEGHRYR